MQVRDIAEMVRDAVPGSTVSFADGAGPDLRNYRVDFSKLEATFPDLNLRWSVREGVDELAAAYAKYGLTYDDFMSSRFVRLRRIRELLSAGLVDECCAARPAEHFPAPGASRRARGWLMALVVRRIPAASCPGAWCARRAAVSAGVSRTRRCPASPTSR